MDTNHFSIATERLLLLPLTGEELRLCREGRHSMEASLGLQTTFAPVDDEVKSQILAALEMMIQLVEEDMPNYKWNTNWEIVLREENRIIGGICFHGQPDSRGYVQVGYVLQSEFRRKGYMAEALRAMLGWAFVQEGVSAVIAETEKDNIPSQRVLRRIGMAPFRETDHTLWWRRGKSQEIGEEE